MVVDYATFRGINKILCIVYETPYITFRKIQIQKKLSYILTCLPILMSPSITSNMSLIIVSPVTIFPVTIFPVTIFPVTIFPVTVITSPSHAWICFGFIAIMQINPLYSYRKKNVKFFH